MEREAQGRLSKPTLQEFLEPYKGVSLATSQDNQEILDFFTRSELSSEGIQLFYDRTPNFFSFLELHSSKYHVFIYRNACGKISGVATLLVRRGYVDGVLEDVAYLGDLRISLDRRFAAIWRRIYSELMSRHLEIEELSKVKVFYTAVVDGNYSSLRNLTDSKNSDFRYHRVCDYQMVNLLARKPFIGGRLSARSFFAENNKKIVADFNEIYDFYAKNQSSIFCGYKYSEEISERLKAWPDFTEENFFAIKVNGKILGACALWSPRKTKKIILRNMPKKLKWSLKAAKILIGEPVSKSGELKTGYITHFLLSKELKNIDVEQVCEAILHECWRRRREFDFEFLSFCHFKSYISNSVLRGFVSQKMSMSVFEVQVKGEKEPSPKTQYGFEMALV